MGFKMKVCVFIDGANFFYGVRSVSKRYSDMSFDFENYIYSLINEEDQIINIFYYNGSLKKTKGFENLFEKQQKFFKRLQKIKNFKVILCKRYKRRKEEKETYTIKGDNIQLTVNILECSYENICDKFILISGDGDFTPVIKHLKSKNKLIEICYFKESISNKLLKQFEYKNLINKKILNKNFYRGSLK